MSVSVEDKIELFRKMIFSDIEELSYENKNKAAESFEQEKSRRLIEVEAKKKAVIEEAEKKAEKAKQQLIAKEKNHEYHKLLDKKQNLINEMVELLYQEAKSFVADSAYKEYLSKSLAKAAAVFGKAESIQLYFTNRDLENLKDYINQSASSEGLKERYVLKTTGDDIIGGFYAEDGKQEMQVDYTLSSLIEENRELIGCGISRKLDEVQGNG